MAEVFVSLPHLRERAVAVAPRLCLSPGSYVKVVRCQVTPFRDQPNARKAVNMGQGRDGPRTLKFRGRAPDGPPDMWVEVDLLSLTVTGGSLGILGLGCHGGHFVVVCDVADPRGHLTCFRIVHTVADWFEIVAGMALRPDVKEE